MHNSWVFSFRTWERAGAVALAETVVLDAAVEIERRKESSSHHDTVYATIQCTCEYVEQHSKLHLNDTEPPELTPYKPSLLPSIKPDVQTDTKQYVSGLVNTASRIYLRVMILGHRNLKGQCQQFVTSTLPALHFSHMLSTGLVWVI